MPSLQAQPKMNQLCTFCRLGGDKDNVGEHGVTVTHVFMLLEEWER